MKFSIRHNTEQGLELVTIKDESNGTEVALLPGFGATITDQRKFFTKRAGVKLYRTDYSEY